MRAKLALGELRSLASLVEAGLLALHDPRIPRQEAFALEDRSQLGIGLDERAGDAVANCAGLPAGPAAVDADAEVVGALQAGCTQRREYLGTMTQPWEVVVEGASVEPGRAVAGAQDHACHGRLPLPGAAVGREVAHLVSSFIGSGLWALCGCSGPA